MQLLTAVPLLLVRLVDEVPEAEDVKAGWLALGIFLGLAVAVAVLGWSLTRQLRKAQAAEDAGLYDPSDRPKSEPIPQADPADQTGQAGQA